MSLDALKYLAGRGRDPRYGFDASMRWTAVRVAARLWRGNILAQFARRQLERREIVDSPIFKGID